MNSEVDDVTDGSRLFAYAVAERTPLYRAVIEIFLASKQRYELRLRPAEVQARLAGRLTADLDPDVVDRALDQLAAWGNLKRLQDTAHARNLDEFLRRRSLYQLTPEGEAAEVAVRRVEDTFGRRGALQSFMLPEVLDDLGEVAALARQESPDPGRIYAALTALFAKFDELADNASSFMATLTDELDRGDLSDDGFRVYKQAVVVYLERFLAELSRMTPRIRDAISEVENVGTESIFSLAASADAAPDRDHQPEPLSEVLARRWEGLRAWFVRQGPTRPVMDLLRNAGLDAVRRLLAIVERLNERRYRRVNRATDLLTLARWFEAASDEDAHHLFRDAFGLASARHLSEVVDDDDTSPATSWWDATPVQVPAHLRTRGRRGRVGRVAAIPDRSDAKRALMERAEAQKRRTQVAAERLARGGPRRCSQLERLDDDALAVLLDLLGRALASDPQDRTRHARSADGAYEIVVDPPKPPRRAHIQTTSGSIELPDFTIDIRVVSVP